jgi:polyisoprenoid-binding protein YceI
MKRTTLAAAIAVAAAAALPAAADVESYTVDPNHTFPAYEIGHFGYSFQRGRFNKTAGRITLDAAAKKGSADVAIDVASVSTGVQKLDQHLQTEDFFDAAKNPQITFKSSDLVFDGDRVAAARGELTIHGVTRPVTFQVTYFRCADHPMLKRKICGADMTTTIQRSDFGMKYGLPVLADDVLLRVNVEAMKD